MTAPSPPVAVTEAGSFTCAHTAERALTKLGDGKLTVESKPVIRVDADGTGAYTGCTFTDPANTTHQCDTTVISVTRTAKLTVGSTAVLLTGDQVQSLDAAPPSPPLTVTVAPGQAKLTAR